MYLNTPQIRKDTVMQPYLGSEEKLLADIKEDERREWMEEQFKYMYSCRARHQLPYELYHWEKIYKVNIILNISDLPSNFLIVVIHVFIMYKWAIRPIADT